MKFNSKALESAFKAIVIEGFKFKKEIMGFSWTRKSVSKIERIVIGYGGSPDSYKVYSPVVEIFFDEVESVLDRYGFDEKHVPTISRACYDIYGVDYQLLSTKIDSYESFEIVKIVVEEIVEKGIYPFLRQFSKLSEVANFLADKKLEEIIPYINGGILLPKTLLILKIAKNERFSSRLVEFRSILSDYAVGNNRYLELLEKYDKLFGDN